MRVVRLNGDLGKKYGRVHKLNVSTPSEALRALCANYPDLQRDLVASGEKGVGYRCVVDDGQISADELAHPMSRSFSITPVVTGAGKVGKIILGAALIAAAFLLPTFSFAIGSVTILSNATLFWLGVAVTLAGVAQLLAPIPKKDDAKNENGIFDGPVNVTAQGAPVPIGYGRRVIGSVVVSAGITAQSQYFYAGGGGSGGFMNNFNGGVNLV